MPIALLSINLSGNQIKRSMDVNSSLSIDLSGNQTKRSMYDMRGALGLETGGKLMVSVQWIAVDAISCGGNDGRP